MSMRRDEESKWLAKAEEALKVAAQLSNPVARAIMLTIAESYQTLAAFERQPVSNSGVKGAKGRGIAGT